MVETNYNLIPKSFYNAETNTLTVDAKLAEAVQAGIQAKLDKLPPVEEEAFLKMTSNLAPGDVDTPEKLSAVLDAFEAAAKLASENPPLTAFVGDIAKFLARAMIEMAGEQRANALNDRLAAREQAKAELLQQADQMKAAAEKMMTGALTSMITGIVGGALSVIGSGISAAGTFSQMKTMGQTMAATKAATQQIQDTSEQLGNLNKLSNKVSGSDLTKVQSSLNSIESANKAASAAQGAATKAFDMANAKVQMFTAVGQFGSAIGETSKAGGSSADAKAQAEAKGMEAEGARDAAEAQYQQQQADNKKQIEDSLNDMIKQIINFIKELKEAEVEAMRALTRV